jgi:hypothetical protein
MWSSPLNLYELIILLKVCDKAEALLSPPGKGTSFSTNMIDFCFLNGYICQNAARQGRIMDEPAFANDGR